MRLALVFALVMFGSFVVLPVLAPYALTLPLGGGAVSTPEKWVWRSVWRCGGVHAGVFIHSLWFGVGSVWPQTGDYPRAADFCGGHLGGLAQTVISSAAARALQGASISSVVVAMVADVNVHLVRTRAMAMIGMSIALTFAGSLVLSGLPSCLIALA